MSAVRETLVVKFGGTSLGTPAQDPARRAAGRRPRLGRATRRRRRERVGHTTDHILETLGALETGRGPARLRARSTGRSRPARTSPRPSSPRR